MQKINQEVAGAIEYAIELYRGKDEVLNMHKREVWTKNLSVLNDFSESEMENLLTEGYEVIQIPVDEIILRKFNEFSDYDGDVERAIRQTFVYVLDTLNIQIEGVNIHTPKEGETPHNTLAIFEKTGKKHKNSVKEMLEDFDAIFYEGLTEEKLEALAEHDIYEVLSIPKQKSVLLALFTSKRNPEMMIYLKVNAIGQYSMDYSKEARDYYGESVFLGFGSTPHERLVNIVNLTVK